MNTKFIKVMVGCLLVCAGSSFAARKSFEAEISFDVKDSKGRPVVDAAVDARLHYVSSSKPFGRRVQEVSAITDTQGKAVLSGQTYGRMDYKVSAPEFYTSQYRMAFSESKREENVILQPKVNPTPMIALKAVHKLIPIQKEPVGFDLVKADWMPPHGNGEHQDIVITAEGKRVEYTHWSTMEVRFEGQYNGIQSMTLRPKGSWSMLKSEYEALGAGYLPMAVFEDTVGFSSKSAYKYADVQYFRIRSMKGLNGKKGGHYGKVYGNMVEMTRSGPALMLEYLFINPTERDRNVEFDPSRNLAPDFVGEFPADSSHFAVDIP
jgi:hypothetical protein